jgi:signal transduction histidine kinase
MKENNIDILRNRQLEMVGRLLAGFSHELKNHLAIIKESNGLISDLLSMGRVEDPALKARLEKITETINKRTLMVAEMAKHLSGFAHRNDVPVGPFQLHDILNEELALLARSANLKSIGLSISFSDTLPAVCNNPSLVQFVFASLFLHVLPTLKAGGKIIVSSGQQNRGISFGLQAEGKAADTVPALDAVDHDQALQEALKVIGATLLIQSTDERINSIVCNLPFSVDSDSAPIV